MPESKSMKGVTMVVLKRDLDALVARVEELEVRAGLRAKPVPKASINKPEKQISEGQFEQPDEPRIKMGYNMKIQSMRNAIKILPPNLRTDDGKHTPENIGAICGFKVTSEMFEQAYDPSFKV